MIKHNYRMNMGHLDEILTLPESIYYPSYYGMPQYTSFGSPRVNECGLCTHQGTGFLQTQPTGAGQYATQQGQHRATTLISTEIQQTNTTYSCRNQCNHDNGYLTLYYPIVAFKCWEQVVESCSKRPCTSIKVQLLDDSDDAVIAIWSRTQDKAIYLVEHQLE